MDLKSSKITMASGETDAVLLADATPFPVFCFGDPPLHAMLIVLSIINKALNTSPEGLTRS